MAAMLPAGMTSLSCSVARSQMTILSSRSQSPMTGGLLERKGFAKRLVEKGNSRGFSKVFLSSTQALSFIVDVCSLAYSNNSSFIVSDSAVTVDWTQSFVLFVAVSPVLIRRQTSFWKPRLTRTPVMAERAQQIAGHLNFPQGMLAGQTAM